MKIDYIDLANKKALDAFEKDYLPARYDCLSFISILLASILPSELEHLRIMKPQLLSMLYHV
jgi:hypothetical protein